MGFQGRTVSRNPANGIFRYPPAIESNASTNTESAWRSPASCGRVCASPKKTRKIIRNVYREVNKTPARAATQSPVLPRPRSRLPKDQSLL